MEMVKLIIVKCSLRGLVQGILMPAPAISGMV